jgi:hypothetical protein
MLIKTMTCNHCQQNKTCFGCRDCGLAYCDDCSIPCNSCYYNLCPDCIEFQGDFDTICHHCAWRFEVKPPRRNATDATEEN